MLQVVAATDSILAAIQKLNRNTALKMDAVTAANYKAGVTAAGSSRCLIVFLIHQ
jgi:hypothetical protein